MILVDTTVFCRNCGVLNAVDRRLCRECRADLASAALPPSPQTYDPESVPVDGPTEIPPMVAPYVDYAPVEGLVCPVCDVPLEEGEAFLEDTRAGMWTGPHLTLTFRFRGVDQHKRMMRDDGMRAAARCRHCGGLWIAPRPPGSAAFHPP